MKAIDWKRVLAAEPAVRRLARDILAVESEPGFCANAAWYGPGGFKSRFLRLVGSFRPEGPKWLKTSRAYDAAYDFLYNLLPDCRHEPVAGCLSLSICRGKLE